MKKCSCKISKFLFSFLVGIIILAWNCEISAGSYVSDEEKLIAAYIERFTRFIEWPAESEIEIKSKPFIICIVGENHFSESFEEIYSKLKIKDKKVLIHYVQDINNIPYCHLAFICDDMKDKLKILKEKIGDQPTLLLSDEPGFAEICTHINLYRENKKIRFEINQELINSSGLYISHLLLRHGKIIKPGKKQ